MAIVTKHVKIFSSLGLLVCCALAMLCIKAARQPVVAKETFPTEQTDSLLDYLNLLFDKTDEHPQLSSRADSLLATIWRAPQTADETLAYYQLITNIAYHLLQRGFIKASSKWYEAAFKFYHQHQHSTALAAEMNIEEYVCKPLGNNYTRIGDFSKAIVMQEFAISSAEKNGKQSMLASLYANLATTYFYMQEYMLVQQITSKALHSITESNESAVLLLYNLKTDAYLELGKMDSAAYWNEKALAYQLPSVEHTNWSVNSLINRSRILNETQQYRAAIGYLQQAWDLSWSLNVKEKAKLSNEIGITWANLNKPADAKIWFKQTLHFFRLDSLNLYPDFNVTTAMFGMAKCYDAGLQSDSASYWSTQAVLNDYYSQQLIDTWLYSQSSIYSNQKLTEAAIAWHHEHYKKSQSSSFLFKALWLAELSKGRVLMYEQQRTKNWQQHPTPADAGFQELRNNYLLLAQAPTEKDRLLIRESIRQLQFELSLSENTFEKQLTAPSYQNFLNWMQTARKASNILSHYATDSAMYIVEITRDQVYQSIDTADAGFEMLDSFINEFYNSPQAFNNDPGAYYKKSNRLLQKFVPHLAQGPAPYIIAPSGLLHKLPFEALCTEPGQPAFLGVRHSISYQFSLLQLIEPARPVEAPVVIFNFEKEHLGFPALPHAKEEVAYLQRSFNTKTYDASQTTDSIFFGALRSNKIVHLATHAVAGDASSQPFILFKEKIYLGQLQHNSAMCPLVVLAACETGKGLSVQNEGLLSLGRAFISKGAEGVLATRWQVDDEAAAQIITGFYQELRNSETPAAALQKARAAYLQKHKAAAAQNPWLWAAFYYQGKNQVIHIQTAAAAYLPVAGTALLLLIILLIVIQIISKRRKNL
ncbi:CHAT domain-containing protein [Niabella insulamsoli]|uniref:CHAT domain-containing protein n=1 Tax=Niabella insulamsoli TaxID=3144874 RepID=UPI0031FBE80B